MNIKLILGLFIVNVISRGQGKPNLGFYQEQIVISGTKNCGSGIGSCSSNLCCSKYGYCGTSNEYCNLSKGCQPKYGLCYEDTDDTPSKKICGPGVGKCASGLCCSKYSYCGSSDDYCNLKKGCQIDYGLCYEDDDQSGSTKKCGKGVGTCSNNLCCSKEGYCGSTDTHCSIQKGCQLDYGLCYDGDGDDDASPIQMCGPSFGTCSGNLCCSSNNQCGNTEAHCNIQKGCQSAYGLCFEDDGTSGSNCGSSYGTCPDSLCCSKEGKCGKTAYHCDMKQGCQVEYGLCYTSDGGDSREGSGKPCGKKYGSCEFPECCSKSGKCLLSTQECLESNGCQPDYGLCFSQI